MSTDVVLARGLGVFSLGLGVVQVLAPRQFSAWLGTRPRVDRQAMVRAVGAREILAAAGLLAKRRPAPFVWLRVAGDVMDLALLARALDQRDVRRGRVSTALASTAAITALDVLSGVLSSTNGRNGRDGQAHLTGSTTLHRDGETAHKPVRKSITVNRPREDVYAYWRRLENLPTFMRHLEEVRERGGNRSHWRATGPAGTRWEWDAETTDDVPNERIAWQSIEGSDVWNAGTVTFADAPGGRGTEIHVEMAYVPPGGPIGAVVAKLFGEEPERQMADDLRRFKQVMEAGEIVKSEATLDNRKLRQRPGQPLEKPMPAAAARA